MRESNFMDARQVHAVVAAGLADPVLLERWRHSPQLLERTRIDAAQIDLDALWKFAGLSEKIRFNPCRTYLASTFRLMNLAGIEIEVFARFAKCAAELRRAGKKSPYEKMAALIEFLRDWHDPEDRRYVLLLDVIRHEYTLAELERAIGLVGSVGSLPNRSCHMMDLDGVPAISGSLWLHQMRFDPRLAVAELRRQSPKLDSLKPSPVNLGYWLDHRSNIYVLDLDELVFGVLACVGGAATARDISARLQSGGAPVSPVTTLNVLRSLSECGVINSV
jgi:hypothetical protein